MYGYGYGYKNSLVVGAGGGFSNTKSLLFDGIDDYVDTGITNTGTNDVSFSFWMKTTMVVASFGSATAFGGRATLNGSTYTLGRLSAIISTPTILRVRCFNTMGTTQINDGNWHHIAFTHNYTTKETKAYVDGGLEVTVTFPAQANAFLVAQGWNGFDSSYQYSGNVDECGLWYSVLSASEITDIYNLGTPTDLTDLNPIAWYRNGDNGAWKSPQWLIPNNENKDKVSNYSMDFDGVNDKIDIGTSLNLGTDSTISMWIKRGRVSTSEIWLGESSYQAGYLVTITAANVLYFRIDTAYVGWNYATVKSIFNSTSDWVNVIIVRSGDSIELFLNGISYGTGNSNFGTPGATATRFQSIAASASSTFTLAQFDEVAAWNNNTVNPLDIYNGGEPTTISGAIAHYKMGEDATFSGGVWTVPDAVGSNTGTSVNMTIEDRIGEAPNSTSNAVSLNMDEVDVVTDTP